MAAALRRRPGQGGGGGDSCPGGGAGGGTGQVVRACAYVRAARGGAPPPARPASLPAAARPPTDPAPPPGPSIKSFGTSTNSPGGRPVSRPGRGLLLVEEGHQGGPPWGKGPQAANGPPNRQSRRGAPPRFRGLRVGPRHAIGTIRQSESRAAPPGLIPVASAASASGPCTSGAAAPRTACDRHGHDCATHYGSAARASPPPGRFATGAQTYLGGARGRRTSGVTAASK